MVTVFLGSGEFSRELLYHLLRAGLDIAAVMTPPDRPAGRGLRLHPTAVKSLAVDEGLQVFQPTGPADPTFATALEAERPDVILVADYGYLLPPEVLSRPARGCVNVHPSLLPRYRGAAPIQRALMHGEKETGVTLMLMDEGMDSGDIIAAEKTAIADDDDAVTLRGRLAALGARVVAENLPPFARGDIVPLPQDERFATYAAPISKEETRIDWEQEATAIHNQVRALRPQPGAHTYHGDKRVKILRSAVCENVEAAPGEIIVSPEGDLLVGAGRGSLQVLELQLEGKKPLRAAEFLRGYRLQERGFFGTGRQG